MSGIPCYSLDDERLAETLSCFSRAAFANDAWVAYHGTSSAFEARIDREGLSWNSDLYGRDDVAAVVRIFRSMNWVGTHTGGFGVLQAYSLPLDFGHKPRKAIFLAETSIRAALYASREWAGGETARALRYAFKDLRSYLTSEDVGREHYARQEDVCIDLLTREGLPSPVIRVNLAWLREAVARLASLEVRCQGLLEAYTHGVIYAIRLTPDRLTGVIRPGGGMGIRVFRRISQTEIVGKVRLTDEECGRVYALRPAVDQRRCDLDLFGAPGSLLASLREKAPGSDPLVPSSGAYVMARDADRDPAAGEDDALQVAHKHGTSEMIEYLKNNPTARTW